MIQYGPLAVWPHEPTPADDRKSRWSFRCDYNDTKALLKTEAAKLGATSILIEGFWRPGDIRLDGQRRADAREPMQPGVVVSFDSQHGGMRYATDSYQDWRHNVRAVALGLEALRAVDRYGITHSAEQYRGFGAIGTGNNGAVNGQAMAFSSKASAEEKLANIVGEGAHALTPEQLYKRAMRAEGVHPDRGGSREMVELVLAAGKTLGVA